MHAWRALSAPHSAVRAHGVLVRPDAGCMHQRICACMHACQGEEAWSNGPCHAAHMDARPRRRVVEATTSARARRRLRAVQDNGGRASEVAASSSACTCRGYLREDCAARKRTHVRREARLRGGVLASRPKLHFAVYHGEPQPAGWLVLTMGAASMPSLDLLGLPWHVSHTHAPLRQVAAQGVGTSLV